MSTVSKTISVTARRQPETPLREIYADTFSRLVRAKFRVKIKSLAEESRIIRLEEKRAKARKDRTTIDSLYEHRTVNVRWAARSTLLAYAYLRGVPYRKLEGPGSQLGWYLERKTADCVVSLLFPYASEELKKRIRADVSEWVAKS